MFIRKSTTIFLYRTCSCEKIFYFFCFHNLNSNFVADNGVTAVFITVVSKRESG